MKKLAIIAAIVGFMAIGQQNASADASGITIRFGGGCNAANTTGTCIIKVAVSGTELDSETVQLYTAAKSGDALKRVSSRLKGVSASGQASFRVRNVAGGCYQVRTGPNGDDKPDTKSRTLCE